MLGKELPVQGEEIMGMNTEEWFDKIIDYLNQLEKEILDEWLRKYNTLCEQEGI